MQKLMTLLVGTVTFLVSSTAAHATAHVSLDQRISELNDQISAKMSAKQKTTIVVGEFSDLQCRASNFGRFFAEELITRLFGTDKFKVIERQLLNKVIAENKLSLTGIVDPASARQLGKLLGIDAVVSGTVSDLAQTVRINARLISTETGDIFAVASTEVFKDNSVTRLMANAGPAEGTGPGAPTTGDIRAAGTDRGSSPPRPPIRGQRSRNFLSHSTLVRWQAITLCACLPSATSR